MRYLFICLTAILFGNGSTYAEPSRDTFGGQRHIFTVERQKTSAHPTLGPANAPVTIDFFLNLGDGFRSARLHELLQTLAQRHPKRLRVVYRLTSRHAQGISAAHNFGREAFVQGRFFDFLEEYYKARHRRPHTSTFPAIAHTTGIDFRRVKQAQQNHKHSDVLVSNHLYWQRMAISRIPGIVINGRTIGHLQDIGVLEEYYDEAYAQAQALLQKGVPQKQIYAQMLAKTRLPRSRRGLRPSGPVDVVRPELEPPTHPVAIDMKPLIATGHRLGSDSAPVVLVFICHHQSAYCSTMARHLQILQKAYSKELAVLYHPLFYDTAPGQAHAHLMHEASLCAEEQDSFWAYTDLAFVQNRPLQFDIERAVELASSPGLGIDTQRFRACLSSQRLSPNVEEEVKRTRKSGIHFTPGIALAGVLYTGRLSFEELRLLVETQLAPGLFRSAAFWSTP